MAESNEALITPGEVEEVVGAASPRWRLPVMAVVGLILVLVLTLLVMIIFSLNRHSTGIDVLLPFLR